MLRLRDDGALGTDAALARLTPRERERAAAIRAPAERRRFVLARGGLRVLLGSRLGLDPAEVPLRRLPSGRVVLPPGGPCLSVAHSGELAVFALADRPVGVDVEAVGAAPGDALVRRTCSPAERRVLDRLDPSRRGLRFVELWTRKEAAVKASGGAAPVAGVRVWPGPLVRGPGLPGPWRARGLDLAPGYAAAVVARGVGWRLLPPRDLATQTR